ncbi:SH3 domain-containing protein [Actinobacteria bacterium YIM 96077]|uniref:SH3b domain-containing protein n=1 Tax=Phytoactinopolyspora halophila TaxID=1981511 RepID=A0A329QTC3_9ACTN|nr:SH3 domain-containing protein [Phytoactinopolyspora halophila]AYY13803.1 SH3 domain-containing protein [Actinobacteria bacterium YIM 96077]RAW15654.1 hypothetical protein DPM12_08380 [Phytoactinopolyspora halophila]
MIIRHLARTFAVVLGTATVVPLGLATTAAAAQPASAQPTTSAQPTSDAPYEGEVIASSSLNARNAPTAASSRMDTLSNGVIVDLQCKVYGPSVAGNDLWYKLADGTWVTARYVANIGAAPHFCGDGEEYQGDVIAQSSLNVRSGPSTANATVSSAPSGHRLPLVCKVDSQNVDGNPRWYQLTGGGGGQWVSARYVANVGAAPPYC